MHLKMWSMQALSGPVLAAVGERYYKVTAEALRVCGELVKAIRPNFDMVRDYFLTYGHVMHRFMVGHLCNCFSQLDILKKLLTTPCFERHIVGQNSY
jgi:hypothetical protein